ncbi:hypothetical protein ACFL6S_14530 [Candidatus Poribacteria bacterium]
MWRDFPSIQYRPEVHFSKYAAKQSSPTPPASPPVPPKKSTPPPLADLDQYILERYIGEEDLPPEQFQAEPPLEPI